MTCWRSIDGEGCGSCIFLRFRLVKHRRETRAEKLEGSKGILWNRARSAISGFWHLPFLVRGNLDARIWECASLRANHFPANHVKDPK